MEQNNIYNSIYKVRHSGGSGSCFYIKESDVFVTNYHVVKGFRSMCVQDNNHNTFLAGVVLVNPSLDIALLKVAGDFSSLTGISLPKEDLVTVGQRINVLGYPYGLPFTVTEGSISSPKQLVGDKYYIQTDAAVNPGNSGGPMLNSQNELIAVTVSKFTEADNMGFGVPVSSLRKVLEVVPELDVEKFNVQCESCDELISEQEDFCPNCGNKLSEDIFKEMTLTDLAVFCEDAIRAMGIDPILARNGYEVWNFHKGSSLIRLFIYDQMYLCCTSPINMLPKKNVESVLRFILNDECKPYKLGVEGSQIYIAYRVHVSDIFSPYQEQIKQNVTNLALKADELDNYLLETFNCEPSEFTKKDVF